MASGIIYMEEGPVLYEAVWQSVRGWERVMGVLGGVDGGVGGWWGGWMLGVWVSGWWGCGDVDGC